MMPRPAPAGLLRRAGRRLRAFGGESRGSSSIEFVILFPIFVTLLCSAAESGTLMLRQVMLDRGLDIAVRDLRLQRWSAVTEDDIRAEICANTVMVTNCTDVLLIEMTPIDIGDSLPAQGATCINRSETVQPKTTITQGVDNQLMLIRICAVFEPFFPGVGLGMALAKDSHGDYALSSTSAFVVEPS